MSDARARALHALIARPQGFPEAWRRVRTIQAWLRERVSEEAAEELAKRLEAVDRPRPSTETAIVPQGRGNG